MVVTLRRKVLIGLCVVLALGAVIGAAFLIDDQLQFKITGKYRVYDMVGQLAPPFTAFDALSGREVGLQDLRGKPSVLVFYASGCPVCKEQMPELLQLQRIVGDAANVRIVSAMEHSSVPLGGRQRLVLSYIGNNDLLDLTAWIAPKEMQKAFEIQATPTIYVLDAEGRVTYAGLSDHSADRLAGLLETAPR